jgi:ribulose-5-phosphate 4-epimerase/fuculose-1-phosphate aldolase
MHMGNSTSNLREEQLRAEICRVGASLYQRGYTVGTAGNISARLDDGWLITPTDACLGFLEPAGIAKVDREGNHISGATPSKTLQLHRAIYARNPQAQSVVHTHSTYLVQLSLHGVWRPDDILPPLTPYYVMKVGHIPLIPYRRPGDPAVAEQVGALAGKVRGVLLERLGPVVWESSPSKAAHALEELEETAKLWHLGAYQGTPLPQDALDELNRVFNAGW